MLFHLYQIYSGKICLASSPHPTSANSIVIACLLAICVSCGHSYTLVFNLTFNDCDRLVEAKKGTALLLDNAALLSQYFALKRVIALTERHIQKTKRFFSWVVLASITINVANFITTFLHSSMIKNVMAEEKYDYDTTVLLVLFAIQFLMPADYLFSFTMAATWSNLLIRYYQSGAFEYRQPSEEIDQIMQSSESNVPRKNQESHDSKTKKT
uniref:Uncharacterized protein n=1 Tax=Ditylenchus dipsaci TaxID=166011 RepID=A0A915DGZ3_9BILA